MDALIPIVIAALGGALPALAWLWFWQREDAPHPEPRRLIALAFFAGMVTVAFVIPIQKYVAPLLPSVTFIFAAWSAIEEIMKYVAARVSVLWRREDDEPIDPVIYMVTVALGFAAAENALFLLSPLSGDTVSQAILTGNLRFIGATLLHVLSSGVVGVFLALSFYRSRRSKRLFAFCGVILAIALHAFFNFLILNTSDEHLLRTFSFVWIGLIVMLAVLEYIKRIHPRIRRKKR